MSPAVETGPAIAARQKPGKSDSTVTRRHGATARARASPSRGARRWRPVRGRGYTPKSLIAGVRVALAEEGDSGEGDRPGGWGLLDLLEQPRKHQPALEALPETEICCGRGGSGKPSRTRCDWPVSANFVGERPGRGTHTKAVRPCTGLPECTDATGTDAG